MRIQLWLLRSAALALVVEAAGCGPECQAEQECTSLDGYAAYDGNGKLAPSSMCGVVASRDGELGSQCGAHFHWDTPSGRCDCDAVEPCEGFPSYTWQGCKFTPPQGAGGGGGGGAGGGGGGGGGGATASYDFGSGGGGAGGPSDLSVGGGGGGGGGPRYDLSGP
jgi:hypothetical protein